MEMTSAARMKMMSALRNSYDETKPQADAFREILKSQLSDVITTPTLPFAVPIESRTKKWSSIADKIDRNSLILDDIKGLPDFIGLRLVFLFSTEVTQACRLIRENFDCTSPEDKSKKLGPNEFGYQSIHLNVRSNLAGFELFWAEIQIRTLSQHNWAVASRRLQYPRLSAVPPSAQRSLNRLAALLELVDMELERVTREKDAYRPQIDLEGETQLNVDLLIQALDLLLPKSHRMLDDTYAELFYDLRKTGIVTVKSLKDLVEEYLQVALRNDAFAIEAVQAGDTSYTGDQNTIKVGVFYSHVGLVQNMLNQKFGTEWRQNP